MIKEKYYNAIVNGIHAGAFPRVPVDYGYRDSKNFWYTRFRRPKAELLPIRETSIDSARYAADRIDTNSHTFLPGSGAVFSVMCLNQYFFLKLMPDLDLILLCLLDKSFQANPQLLQIQELHRSLLPDF